MFLIDTTAGAVTVTLPSLALGDAGWECSFLKTNTGLSPYFIAPPTGTIQLGDIGSLAKTRRCIPGVKTRVFLDRVELVCGTGGECAGGDGIDV